MGEVEGEEEQTEEEAKEMILVPYPGSAGWSCGSCARRSDPQTRAGRILLAMLQAGTYPKTRGFRA